MNHMEAWLNVAGVTFNRVPAVETGDTKEQSCVLSHISAAKTALEASRASGTNRENFWCIVLEDDTSPQKDTDMMNDVRDIIHSLPEHIHCVQLHTVQQSLIVNLAGVSDGTGSVEKRGKCVVNGYGHGCQAYVADIHALQRIADYDLSTKRNVADGNAWGTEKDRGKTGRPPYECAVYSRADTAVYTHTIVRHEGYSENGIHQQTHFSSTIHKTHNQQHMKAQNLWDRRFHQFEKHAPNQDPKDNYRMGDVFLHYNTHSPSESKSFVRDHGNKVKHSTHMKDTIMQQYTNRATTTGDTLALAEVLYSKYNRKELLVESNTMRVHIRLGDALGDKEPHQRRLRPSMAAYTTQAIVKDTIVQHFIEKKEQAHIMIHIGMHQHKSNTPMAEPFQRRSVVYAYQVATMMKTFYEKRGNNVVVAVAGRDKADSDFLKMFRAGLFVVGRGGFSRTIELMRTHNKLPCVRIPEITSNYEYSRAEQRRTTTRNHNRNRRTPDGSDMDST